MQLYMYYDCYIEEDLSFKMCGYPLNLIVVGNTVEPENLAV